MLGESEIVLAGGIESMSRMPYLVDAVDARWGHRMGNFTLVDAMYRDGFQCPLSNLIMGETAEILAKDYGITRDESDCFALESQRKAKAAIDAGHFEREIAPVSLQGRTPTIVDRDEHPRGETTIESLRKLPPVFGDGIITAGTSSGITDGGAALILASADEAQARGLTARAKILGWASAGVDPRIMGIGPVPAIKARRADWPQRRRLRSRRAERSVRGAGDRGPEGRPDFRGPLECERRCDCARPSDRRHRRPNRGHAPARTRTPRCEAWSRDAVCQRRDGNGFGDRESLRI
jgi:hypothetical protein